MAGSLRNAGRPAGRITVPEGVVIKLVAVRDGEADIMLERPIDGEVTTLRVGERMAVTVDYGLSFDEAPVDRPSLSTVRSGAA